MFGFIKKMFGATEKTTEVAVEEVAVEEVAVEEVAVKVVEKVKMTKKQLEAMTKKQLEEYGREFGIELDRRLKKATLVAQLVKMHKDKKD